MTVPRLDLAPFELTPQVYWQPGERERLAATESARYFSTESLAERMEHKSGRVVLQELGFGDDVWLFLNYILLENWMLHAIHSLFSGITTRGGLKRS